MRKCIPSVVAIAIVLLASLVPEFPSTADAAPPLTPPGSNIAPGAQTMVQMLSENVLLLVKKDASEKFYVSVSAEFLMENQGNTDEYMQVRFPMEDVGGEGDGWGERPTVRNFSVTIDGQWVGSQEIQEPFQAGGVPVSWSTFPADFPVHEKKYIRVYYDTDLGKNAQKWTGYSKADYILETGSGWHGPIGRAVITLRLPFDASETTVLQADSRPVTFVGHEARYVFQDLEPGPSDNIEFLFVHPAVWTEALDLEFRTGENPKDVDAIVQLADIYLDLATVCPPRGNYFINEHPQFLAETIVAQGLFYSPDRPDLLAEQAKTDYRRYVCGQAQSWDSPQVQNVSHEVDYVLSLDPDNPIALELKDELDFWKGSSHQSTPSEEPFISSSETPTAFPNAASTPTQSQVPAVPSKTAAAANSGSSSTGTFSGIGAGTVLLGFFLFLGGAGLGACLVRARRYPSA